MVSGLAKYGFGFDLFVWARAAFSSYGMRILKPRGFWLGIDFAPLPGMPNKTANVTLYWFFGEIISEQTAVARQILYFRKCSIIFCLK